MIDGPKKTLCHLAALLTAIIPLFALGLSNHGLWPADEPRVAEIGREMALTGNWAVPTLNRKPFLEQPPLYYGALAVTFTCLGVSDRVVRIPSALFAFATVIALFLAVSSLLGPRIALFSGLILSTAGEYFRVAHWVLVDSALTFFVVSSLASFIVGYLMDNGRKKLAFYVLAYVAATFAFYSKGFIGIAIPGAAILAFLMVERNYGEVLRMRLWLGLLIFLVMTLPWFIELWRQGGREYLTVFFVHNHLQRFLPMGLAGPLSDAASGHHHPFYFYLTEFPDAFLPWSILLCPVLYHAFSRKSRGVSDGGADHTLRHFALCWFFPGVILLSMASTKRSLYMAPLLAPISLLTAMYVDSLITSPCLNRMDRIFLWAFDLLLLALGLAFIPGYLYGRHAFPEAVSGRVLPAAVALSLLVSLTSLAGARCLSRGRMTGYWTSISLCVVLLFLSISIEIIPVLDGYKSFVPFCRGISSLVPLNEPLYGYKPDETLRGAVPFYTGRFIIETEDTKEDSFPRRGPFSVVVRDKQGGPLEKELAASGEIHLLLRQFMGSGRRLDLLSTRPGQTIILNAPF